LTPGQNYYGPQKDRPIKKKYVKKIEKFLKRPTQSQKLRDEFALLVRRAI
jgi:hypothetical protein